MGQEFSVSSGAISSMLKKSGGFGLQPLRDAGNTGTGKYLGVTNAPAPATPAP